MIVPSLFSSELSNLPQAPQTPAYGPEYFNKVQQYYSGYLPGQTLDTQALSDWYSSSKDIPFGGTYFAPSPSAGSSTGLLGGDTGGGGGGDSMQSAPSEQLDDAGLAQSYNLDPRAIQGIGLLGSMLGIPFSSLLGGFKNPLADYLSKQSYQSAVDKNTALVAAQLGLDPKDPANAAAIAAAVDSLSAANQGTTAATTGPTGTGGAAASVAEQAAANAAALGFGDAAIGAAAQAAANAALSGASQAAAAQAGIDAAISANNVAAGEAAAAEAASQASQSVADQNTGGDGGGYGGYGGDSAGSDSFGGGEY